MLDKRLLKIIAALLLSAFNSTAFAQSAGVTIDGAFYQPESGVSPSGRLADAILQASPRPDAYLLGSSFLRTENLEGQIRLRAGLAYGLAQLQKIDDGQVNGFAQSMIEWLASHPATGRVVLPRIAPRLMQVQPNNNPILAEGDVLLVPVRPRTITILGAVGSFCSIAHDAQRDARDYVRECGMSKAADLNTLYVIQPDGRIQQLGIALWNRADTQAVAPGGTIFVPVREGVTDSIDPAFNRDFATFIATQPITP